MTSFCRAVYELVRRIPPGRVGTYGQIAALLGAPRAARAVGWAMKRCPPGVPWHRVVNAQGGISARANPSGMVTQRIRLEQEGVRVRRGRVALERHRWRAGRRVAGRGPAGVDRRSPWLAPGRSAAGR